MRKWDYLYVLCITYIERARVCVRDYETLVAYNTRDCEVVSVSYLHMIAR